MCFVFFISKGAHTRQFRAKPYSVYNAKSKLKLSRRGRVGDWRTRFDKVDRFDKLTLRRAGKMHHLGVGVAHRGVDVLMLINEETVMATSYATGQVPIERLIAPLGAADSNKKPWIRFRRFLS